MAKREMGDFGWLISTTRSFYFNNVFVIDYYIIAIFMTKVREKFITCWTCFLRNKNFLYKFCVILLIKYTNKDKRDEAKILYSQVMLGHVNVDQMKKNVREQFYAGFFYLNLHFSTNILNKLLFPPPCEKLVQKCPFLQWAR